ncbi:MAG: SH3 domain-containing protein, partial [Clostridia bacterium]|nr:SH3 domain-containing protein [Clostridia bacterium]
YQKTYVEPDPVPPATADITIQYVSDGGVINESETVTVTEVKPYTANARSYEGYDLISSGSVTVEVYADGSASVNPVVFQYQKTYVEPDPVPPVSVDVEVIYQTLGGQTLGVDTVTCVEDHHNEITAPAFDGYTLAEGVEAVRYVSVYSDGSVSENPVVFTYAEIPAEPQPEPEEPVVINVTITVHYRNAAGESVATSQQGAISQAGVYGVDARPSDLQEGYVLAEGTPAAYQVEVYADGTASQYEFVFLYEKEQTEPEQPVVPANVTVTVRYKGQEGQDIAPAQQATLPVNAVTTVAPDVYVVPADYDIASAAPVQVSVDASGVATPAEVVFTFAKLVVEEPDVPVPQGEMINRFGTLVKNKVNVRAEATTDSKSLGRLAKNTVIYMLRAEVNEDGVVWYRVLYENQQAYIRSDCIEMMTKKDSDAYMAANYPQPLPEYTHEDLNGTEPVTVDVPVIYQLEDGTELDRQSTPATSAQTVTVTPASGKVPADYVLISAPSVQVTVNAETGAAEPAQVVFTYRLPAPVVKTADVPVIYQLEDGTELDRLSVHVTSEQPVNVTPVSSKVPADYVLISAPGVQVTVNTETGAAEPAQVVFTYRLPAPEVKTAEVTVLYVTEEGAELDRQTVICSSDAERIVTPTSGKTEGYALVSAGSVTVTVDAQSGLPSQSEVRFTYRALPPATVSVSVPVIYVNENGEELDRQMVTCTSAVPTTVIPASSRVNGYNLISASSVQVVVDAVSGAAEPAEVRFVYARPAQYVGYALTTETVALRTEISASDSSIIKPLAKDTLLYVYNQQYAEDGQAWSTVSTLDEQPGMVPHSSLRTITKEEAQWYIDKWEAEQEPEISAPPTETPPQIVGTAVTVGDGVFFRQTYDFAGAIIAILPANTEVEVLGQAYDQNGDAWHSVKYSGVLGFIRADMLHMVTTEADPQETVQPTINPDTLSSYGYVNASSVNFRSAASTSASRLGVLRRYAMCLVLGTEQVGDTTWYRVKYNEQEGYVSGKYFQPMTISEFTDFLTSDEYRQGVANNSAANNNQDNTGDYTGGVIPEEDKVVDEWTNPNNGLQVSYAPFDPFATVAPIQTDDALPTATRNVTATPAPTLEMLPAVDVNSPGDKEETGGFNAGWIIAIVLLVLAGGGVYAYVLYSQNKRRAAQRAAQRRAQAAQQQRASAQQQRSMQSGQANQPRTGVYTNQAGTARPSGYQQPQARRPYTPGAQQNPYQRPSAPQKETGEQSASYSRPSAFGEDRPSYTASYREGGSGSTHRVGSRAYRNQQNAARNESASRGDNDEA